MAAAHHFSKLSPAIYPPRRVELKPTLQQLFDTVHGTCNAAVAALEALPRLVPEVLGSCAAAGALPTCLRWVGGGWILMSLGCDRQGSP